MVCSIALLAVSSIVIHCRLALIVIVQLKAAETTNMTVAKRPRVTDSTSPDKRDGLIQELPGNKCPIVERPAHARVKHYSVIYVLFRCTLVATGCQVSYIKA